MDRLSHYPFRFTYSHLFHFVAAPFLRFSATVGNDTADILLDFVEPEVSEISVKLTSSYQVIVARLVDLNRLYR